MARQTGLPYCCGVGVLGDFGEDTEQTPAKVLAELESNTNFSMIVATTSRGHHHGGGPQLEIEEFLIDNGFEATKKFMNHKITGNEVTFWTKILPEAALDYGDPQEEYEYFDDRDDIPDEEIPF